MKKIRIAAALLLPLAAFGLFVFAFAQNPGSTNSPTAALSEDPDLPAGGAAVEKEEYLRLRDEWLMLRRGFVPGLEFDPEARSRAIEQMEQQLRTLEAERPQGSRETPPLSATAWTPVGPAPVPQGQ